MPEDRTADEPDPRQRELIHRLLNTPPKPVSVGKRGKSRPDQTGLEDNPKDDLKEQG